MLLALVGLTPRSPFMTEKKKAPGVLLVTLLFAAVLGYGIWLFNFGPFARLSAMTGGISLPEERFGYTGGDLYTFLEQFEGSADFLSLYGSFQLFDTLNAVLIALALAIGIWALTARLFKSSIPGILVLFPLAMGAFDLLENLLIVSVLRNLPLRFFGIAEGAGTASLLKMISGSLAFLSFSALSVYALYLRYRKDKK